MKMKPILGIMEILLMMNILTLAFDIQPARSYALLSEDSTDTILSIQPDNNTAPIGAVFVVNITIVNVTDLYSYGFHLRFDPDVIHLTRYISDIITISTWYDPWLDVEKSWGISGMATMSVGAPKGGKGVNGSGTIAQIRFTVVGPGSTSIFFRQSLPNYGLWDSNGAEIQYVTRYATFRSSILANVDICPHTLNLKSKGKWISGHIELMEGHSVGEINVSTILLNDEVPAESGKVRGKKLNVRFDRSRVIASLPQVDEVELMVTGKLFNGTPFEGSDSIRVE